VHAALELAVKNYWLS